LYGVVLEREGGQKRLTKSEVSSTLVQSPEASTLTMIWVQSLNSCDFVSYGARLGIVGTESNVLAKSRGDGIFPTLDIPICSI
jgi:hypothetical protein